MKPPLQKCCLNKNANQHIHEWLPPNSASTNKRIWPNGSIFNSVEIIRKTVFLLISVGIKLNEFARIYLIVGPKFDDAY